MIADELGGWPKQTCKRRRKKRVSADPFAVNLARVNRLSPGSALLDLPQIAVDGVDRDAELARGDLGTVF